MRWGKRCVDKYTYELKLICINYEIYWKKEWGAGIVSDNNNIMKNTTAAIKVIRLSEFVLNVVAKRLLPNVVNRTRPPTVLMKLDIEGLAMIIFYYKAGCMITLQAIFD